MDLHTYSTNIAYLSFGIINIMLYSYVDICNVYNSWNMDLNIYLLAFGVLCITYFMITSICYFLKLKCINMHNTQNILNTNHLLNHDMNYGNYTNRNMGAIDVIDYSSIYGDRYNYHDQYKNSMRIIHIIIFFVSFMIWASASYLLLISDGFCINSVDSEQKKYIIYSYMIYIMHIFSMIHEIYFIKHN